MVRIRLSRFLGWGRIHGPGVGLPCVWSPTRVQTRYVSYCKWTIEELALGATSCLFVFISYDCGAHRELHVTVCGI